MPEPLRVVTKFAFEPDEILRLQSAVPERAVQIMVCWTQDEFCDRLETAEVIFGSCRGSHLAQAAGVKWIQSSAAGVDNLDPELRESPVILTNYAGPFAPGIAETAFGLLLSLTR